MKTLTLLANKRIRIKPGICLLIKRSLKGPGRLIAQKNVEVAPHDILGHYKQTLGFTKINIASELEVFPAEVPKLLQKAVGQTVFKGELLAAKQGIFKKSQIIAPTDGIFQNLNEKTGEATIRFLPKDVPLTAGVFGVIKEVDHQKGEVYIKSLTSELYGIYGSGSEREGFLNIVAGSGDLVNRDKITQDHRGQILVAGSLALEATIRKALSYAVSGIICGGLNMDDYRAMAVRLNPFKRVGTDMGISVVATEGFGIIPIGEDLFEILKRHNGRFAIIQGNFGRILLPSDDPDSILVCRKVELPFKEAQGVRPEITIGEINLGSKVRLIAPPFMGSQGEVVAIDKNATKLQSGILSYLITVATRNRKIRVVFSNVELI